MTMPLQDSDEYEILEPIPVKPIPEEQVTDAATCSWQTIIFQGTEDAAQLLPQDKKRHKARIYIQGAAANSVLLGQQGQMSNNRGGQIFAGQIVEYTASSAVWIKANNGVVTVTVQDERY